MIFSFTRSIFHEDADKKKIIEKESYITLWVRGNEKIESALDIEAIKSDFGYGDIYTFKDVYESSKKFQRKVKSKIGGLISVGGNYIINGFSMTKIIPNQQEIMGHIKKGEHEIECFNLIKDSNIPYSNENVLFLSGIIFNKIANIFYLDENKDIVASSQRKNNLVQ